MTVDVENLISMLEEDHRLVSEKVRALTPEEANWSPSPTVWPIVMILDHVNRVNRLTVPLFESSIAGAPLLTKGVSFRPKYSFFEKQFVKILSPGSRIHFPVPPIFEPTVPS